MGCALDILPGMTNPFPCPVCGGASALLDVVDFNKSCEEMRGQFLPLSGAPIYYALCPDCGFCHAPEIAAWPLEEFERWIYNDDYAAIDPDYLQARPANNAASLVSMFGHRAPAIRHLDYGGGSGVLSRLLGQSGWQSASYDPYVDRGVPVSGLGRFDLITAYEVFEHVPDARQLMSDLRTLLAPDGVILFSTLVSDGHIHPNQRLTWWYAAPRNGHISLYSRKSLATLAAQSALRYATFSEGFHTFFSAVPPWARHLLGGG
jgi:SAM-dependent methyltransferase